MNELLSKSLLYSLLNRIKVLSVCACSCIDFQQFGAPCSHAEH